MAFCKKKLPASNYRGFDVSETASSSMSLIKRGGLLSN